MWAAQASCTWDTGARPCAFLLNWIMKPSRVCCVPLESCRRMTARAHNPENASLVFYTAPQHHQDCEHDATAQRCRHLSK